MFTFFICIHDLSDVGCTQHGGESGFIPQFVLVVLQLISNWGFEPQFVLVGLVWLHCICSTVLSQFELVKFIGLSIDFFVSAFDDVAELESDCNGFVCLCFANTGLIKFVPKFWMLIAYKTMIDINTNYIPYYIFWTIFSNSLAYI